jgi:hypothetical protein
MAAEVANIKSRGIRCFLIHEKTKMKTPEQLQRLLADRNIETIYRATAISRPTLYRLRDGSNDSPTYETVRKLSEYFEAQEEALNRPQN